MYYKTGAFLYLLYDDMWNETKIVYLYNTFFNILAHLFPMHSSLPLENIWKPYTFLMFSVGRERVVVWEQMG